MKTLFGASCWLLHETVARLRRREHRLSIPGDADGRRGAVDDVPLRRARLEPYARGSSRPCSSALMPRVFFHAHLACFDVPIMTLWIVCIYVHWRAQERRGILWALAAGVVFGLALETKHNAWLLPCGAASRTRSSCIAARSCAALRAGATVDPGEPRRRWRSSGRSCSSRCGRTSGTTRSARFAVVRRLPPESRVLQHRISRPELLRAAVAQELPAGDGAGDGPRVTLLLFGVGAIESRGRRRRGASARGRRGSRRAVARDGVEPRARTTRARRISSWRSRSRWRSDRSFSHKTPIFGGTKHWLPAYPALALFAGRGSTSSRPRCGARSPGCEPGAPGSPAEGGALRERRGRAARRSRRIAPVRPLVVRAARRRDRRRRRPRAQSAVLGLHDRGRGRGVPERSSPAGGDRLHPRYDVGRVVRDAGGGARPPRPARHRAPHEAQSRSCSTSST